MSVLKSKRKPSQFEVFHHLNKVRKEVTDLLLRDFGYSKRKAAQRLEKKFSGRSEATKNLLTLRKRFMTISANSRKPLTPGSLRMSGKL